MDTAATRSGRRARNDPNTNASTIKAPTAPRIVSTRVEDSPPPPVEDDKAFTPVVSTRVPSGSPASFANRTALCWPRLLVCPVNE